MPIKKETGESKEDFIGRCVSVEINNGYSSPQAIAMCYAIWDEQALKSLSSIRNDKYKEDKWIVKFFEKNKIGMSIKDMGLTLEDFYNPKYQQRLTEKDLEMIPMESFMEEFETYSDYPEAAKENAKIALRWAEENGWGSCGTPVGKVRANQLANGENISRETIARMAGFERHRQNSQKELGDGCGRLMWLAWGGDAGIAWAQRKLKQIDKDKNLSKFAEEDYITIYKYVSETYGSKGYGPNSRPFCVTLMKQKDTVFTMSDITALNNAPGKANRAGGGGYSVFKYRGGNNCLHKWIRYTYDPITQKLIEPAFIQPNQPDLR